MIKEIFSNHYNLEILRVDEVDSIYSINTSGSPEGVFDFFKKEIELYSNVFSIIENNNKSCIRFVSFFGFKETKKILLTFKEKCNEI